jgi:predicted dehydrogenase
MQYQMRNWYYFVWLCGDHIVEQHVHHLDVCNWVKGEHPVEATGMGGCEVRDNTGVGQIYDHHAVEFTYADGTKMFSYCRQQPGCWEHSAEYVHGTRGVSNCRSGTRALSPYQQEHVDLVAAIRKGNPYNEGWFGATSTMTAVLGRMATYSGQVVKWDEAVSDGPRETPEKVSWNDDPPVKPDADGNYPVAVPGIYQPY